MLNLSDWSTFRHEHHKLLWLLEPLIRRLVFFKTYPIYWNRKPLNLNQRSPPLLKNNTGKPYRGHRLNIVSRNTVWSCRKGGFIGHHRLKKDFTFLPSMTECAVASAKSESRAHFKEMVYDALHRLTAYGQNLSQDYSCGTYHLYSTTPWKA